MFIENRDSQLIRAPLGAQSDRVDIALLKEREFVITMVSINIERLTALAT